MCTYIYVNPNRINPTTNLIVNWVVHSGSVSFSQRRCTDSSNFLSAIVALISPIKCPCPNFVVELLKCKTGKCYSLQIDNTYNFVHNMSKLCDKCYKLLNESVLSGPELGSSWICRERFQARIERTTRYGFQKRINYNGHSSNGETEVKGLFPEVN